MMTLIMAEIFEKYKLALVLVAVALVFLLMIGVFIWGMSVGAKDCELASKTRESVQLIAYNQAMTALQSKHDVEQRRANDLGVKLNEAQQSVVLLSSELKRSVKDVVQINQERGDSCAAFSDNGLQLYERALGY